VITHAEETHEVESLDDWIARKTGTLEEKNREKNQKTEKKRRAITRADVVH
jgi:hypothetical protein